MANVALLISEVIFICASSNALLEYSRKSIRVHDRYFITLVFELVFSLLNSQSELSLRVHCVAMTVSVSLLRPKRRMVLWIWFLATDKPAASLLTELLEGAKKSLVNAFNTWRTLCAVAIAPVVAEMWVLMLLTLTFLARSQRFDWLPVLSFQPADLYFL